MSDQVHVFQKRFAVSTRGRGPQEITDYVADIVAESGVRTGTVQVFTHHTSCGLLIGENADPSVCRDLDRFFGKVAPDGDPMFEHDAEGDDDMPAHVRSVLTGVSLGIPVSDGRAALGTWQGIFVWEHRTVPHERRVTVTVTGLRGG
ncbi:secondary thiamine-phosphate synthase enzyme YjbQ [Oleiagrimonas sp. C23AA]|uniref:secondary thiamine-phosphate synthase enzyme YjbQ n=1 Tax=Oleiagrimonas sp. C23AA TaxID=2719047 RepID=UPI00142262AA|nr:secondary thiamine-phosphate synthase enzyme YjbQ [Oleiagrimonas sp. C23AA]NII12003.1 YjbQ family protein [Oleiagrimonas sp. C23AA]